MTLLWKVPGNKAICSARTNVGHVSGGWRPGTWGHIKVNMSASRGHGRGGGRKSATMEDRI